MLTTWEEEMPNGFLVVVDDVVRGAILQRSLAVVYSECEIGALGDKTSSLRQIYHVENQSLRFAHWVLVLPGR